MARHLPATRGPSFISGTTPRVTRSRRLHQVHPSPPVLYQQALRARGDALVVLLAGVVAAAAGRLVVPMFDRGDPAYGVDMDVRPFVVVSRVLIAVTGLAFLIWFRRARINAEGRGWHQRFARAWTFW